MHTVISKDILTSKKKYLLSYKSNVMNLLMKIRCIFHENVTNRIISRLVESYELYYLVALYKKIENRKKCR